MEKNKVIIINTDDQKEIEPGFGLINTRSLRLQSMLGSNENLTSIVIQAFNRLEKTIICVDSVLRFTPDHAFEMILIDNGSSDGTFDFYKSINYPRKTIIRVTKNISSIVPFQQVINGRYIAYICNDTYVTSNWLTNLLTCINSDPRIGMAVPATSNASNLQGIDLSFNSLEEMFSKAKIHNISDPRKWNERLRLVLQMGLFKREALDAAGILLDYGFFHDFADDDTTFRIRRAGYKAILCKDTFVHHDHVRSEMSEVQKEEFNESIQSGKDDFSSKYFGLDSWKDVNNYEQELLSFLVPTDYSPEDTIEILGIEVLCGTPILEIKNKLRENSIFKTNLSAFTSDAKYWLDLKTICTGDVIVENSYNLDKAFPENHFDIIIIGKSLEYFKSPLDVLSNVYKNLKENGVLLFRVNNPSDFMHLFDDNFTNPYNASSSNSINEIGIDLLLSSVNQIGYKNHRVLSENWPLDPDQAQVVSETIERLQDESKENIDASNWSIKEFLLICRK
jgi:GT2 family glycosyltransferase/SAM-dependent methyltransferase